MTRIRFLLLFMVVIPLLVGAGCLQEPQASGGTKDTSVTRHVVMQQHLHAVANATQDTLDGIDSTVSNAADALGTTGLSGPEADAVLADLATYHPALLSAITLDPNGTVHSAEPECAKVLSGQNIRDQQAIHQVLSNREPAMGDLFSLWQGGEGVAMVYPVFSPDGTFLGAVSAAFSPYVLIAPFAGESMRGAPFIYNVVQTDGRILYHANASLVGKPTFNESTFAAFPEILELARRYSTERSGYATFRFYGAGTDVIVEKETFWDTIALHGTEWRVMVIGER